MTIIFIKLLIYKDKVRFAVRIVIPVVAGSSPVGHPTT
ncbi:hypothetical protein EBME_2334 [bacterium endosymbiont of Mortierella elongata FMR23-6]|nr:hypothetical protein EBME_2334 [bacterium endosymbiont of Mortierella elongata FMR23-6]